MAGVKIGDRFVSKAEIVARAQRAANALAARGVGAGDVIALYLRNDIAFLEASVAASLLGAYATPVNWHNTAEEAAYIFGDSGAKAIVAHADLYHGFADRIPAGVDVFIVATPPEIATAYAIPPKRLAVPANVQTWDGLIAENAPPIVPAATAPATMIYTSGTTGHPKGVRRDPPTAEQRAATARLRIRMYGTEASAEGVTAVMTGPMYHSAPNAYGLWMFNAGARLVLQPRFDPEEFLALVERERITHAHMVPTMFVRLLKLSEDTRRKYDLSSLRFVVHAAAPCPVHVKQAMIEWWGPIINEYYGGTETSGVTFCDSAEWLAHPGTVGRPVPDADVRVIGADDSALPAGEVGEVVCRILTLPDFTYHGDDAKRRAAARLGLISLGDIGYFDADGYLFLCDRSRDMIISGGVNIYPAEIEAELHKAHGVADCAVFGIPDDEFGERVHAVVQLAPGATVSEQDLRTFLQTRIAGYKVPRSVEFAETLPREDSGKIFKRKLREPYWANVARRI